MTHEDSLNCLKWVHSLLADLNGEPAAFMFFAEHGIFADVNGDDEVLQGTLVWNMVRYPAVYKLIIGALMSYEAMTDSERDAIRTEIRTDETCITDNSNNND
jgi:hypothetical protein